MNESITQRPSLKCFETPALLAALLAVTKEGFHARLRGYFSDTASRAAGAGAERSADERHETRRPRRSQSARCAAARNLLRQRRTTGCPETRRTGHRAGPQNHQDDRR